MKEKNVFVNCPFDNNYFNLLKPLLFTIVYLDYNPLICENNDSSQYRLERIMNLMKDSLYSIHDLSRTEIKVPKTKSKNNYPRFNMPFECGIDFGLKHFEANTELFKKNFIILAKENYEYTKYISDISGNDIKIHENNPEKIIRAIRDWFKTNQNDIPVPPYTQIWVAYNLFIGDYEVILKAEHNYTPDDINSILFKDLIESMKNFVLLHKVKDAKTKIT